MFKNQKVDLLKNQKVVEKNVKKLKNWKNGLNSAILGKCDKSDQSLRGKRDSIFRKNQETRSKVLRS